MVARTQKLPLYYINLCYIDEIAVLYVRTKTNQNTPVAFHFKEGLSVSPWSSVKGT